MPQNMHRYRYLIMGECLIIPGLTDLHACPQHTFRGSVEWMELLLEWLETNTFPEEAKYQDLEYARRAYRIFTDNLKRSVTTRVRIFGTITETPHCF